MGFLSYCSNATKLKQHKTEQTENRTVCDKKWFKTLPAGHALSPFLPAVQRSAPGSLGLGLALSRWPSYWLTASNASSYGMLFNCLVHSQELSRVQPDLGDPSHLLLAHTDKTKLQKYIATWGPAKAIHVGLPWSDNPGCTFLVQPPFRKNV